MARAIAAVVSAGGFHVEHVVDADHARLDRLRHRLLDDSAPAPGVVRRDGDLRRHDVGKLRDRESASAHEAAMVMTIEMTTARRGRAMKVLESMAIPPA
jgi:hypothetical protein